MTVREVYSLYENKRKIEQDRGAPFDEEVRPALVPCLSHTLLTTTTCTGSHTVSSEVGACGNCARFCQRHEALRRGQGRHHLFRGVSHLRARGIQEAKKNCCQQ